MVEVLTAKFGELHHQFNDVVEAQHVGGDVDRRHTTSNLYVSLSVTAMYTPGARIPSSPLS
jgi:hypothetical protein